MPDLETLGLDVNPSTDPIHYPGALTTTNCLVTESWLYPLQYRRGTRVGGWTLGMDGGPLTRHAAGRDHLPLDEMLRLAGVAAMAGRYPVVAVGSNAAPGQLRHKFSTSRDVSNLVPLTRGTVRGIEIGHSAHVGRAGYLPYAPVADSSAVRDLFVLWLDRDQRARIDETELNYDPVLIHGEVFPLVLESGESLRQYGLYRSKWGVIRLTSEGPPAEAVTQTEIITLLARLPWFQQLVPECLRGVEAALGAFNVDERRRIRVREAFAQRGLASPDGLPQLSTATGPLTEDHQAPWVT